jgi:acyl dehydratase
MVCTIHTQVADHLSFSICGVANLARRHVSTLHFEDLAVGDEWESPRRTITEADVAAFAGLSGDFNPLHMDHESAAAGPFGRPVAHGLLGLSVVSGLGSQAPRVETLAFLEIAEWRFLEPIGFGDTVHVLTRVEGIEPKARGRRAIVTWHRQLINQHGKVVQEGRTRTLVRGRAGAGPEA